MKMIRCKNCGTVYPNEMSNCPNCFKKNNDYTIRIILGIIIFLTIFIGYLCIFDSIFNYTDTVTDSLTGDTGSVVKRVEKVNLGESLHTDGLIITLTKVEDWKPTEKYITAEDGYKFIRAYFIIENINANDVYITATDFDCYADDKKMKESIYGDDELEWFSNLSAGRKIEGYIYYEVPKNAQKIEIEFEKYLWTDKKAIFLTE